MKGRLVRPSCVQCRRLQRAQRGRRVFRRDPWGQRGLWYCRNDTSWSSPDERQLKRNGTTTTTTRTRGLRRHPSIHETSPTHRLASERRRARSSERRKQLGLQEAGMKMRKRRRVKSMKTIVMTMTMIAAAVTRMMESKSPSTMSTYMTGSLNGPRSMVSRE